MFGGVDTNHVPIGAVVALAVVGVLWAVHISTSPTQGARRIVRDRSPLNVRNSRTIPDNRSRGGAGLLSSVTDYARTFPLICALFVPYAQVVRGAATRCHGWS